MRFSYWAHTLLPPPLLEWENLIDTISRRVPTFDEINAGRIDEPYASVSPGASPYLVGITWAKLVEVCWRLRKLNVIASVSLSGSSGLYSGSLSVTNALGGPTNREAGFFAYHLDGERNILADKTINVSAFGGPWVTPGSWSWSYSGTPPGGESGTDVLLSQSITVFNQYFAPGSPPDVAYDPDTQLYYPALTVTCSIDPSGGGSGNVPTADIIDVPIGSSQVTIFGQAAPLAWECTFRAGPGTVNSGSLVLDIGKWFEYAPDGGGGEPLWEELTGAKAYDWPPIVM